MENDWKAFPLGLDNVHPLKIVFLYGIVFLSLYRAFAVQLAPIFFTVCIMENKPYFFRNLNHNVEKNIIRAKVRNFTFNLGQIGSNASLDMS